MIGRIDRVVVGEVRVVLGADACIVKRANPQVGVGQVVEGINTWGPLRDRLLTLGAR